MNQLRKRVSHASLLAPVEEPTVATELIYLPSNRNKKKRVAGIFTSRRLWNAICKSEIQPILVFS
jgi:hypothetical protein